MKHYGDITKINGAEAPVVDIITGGSPCQDLSVAGKRAGLAGERSGLFMEQMRIVKEMRERERATGRTGWMVRPRYMVWENVPGAFSSGNPKGADFAAVIEEIIKVAEPGASVSVCVPNGGWTKSGCYYAEDGSWSLAWRVHDAQFWGVPQRRKRIALVADFGGLSAPEILFEREGLSGDSEQSGAQREATAAPTGGGAEGASGCLKGFDVQSKRIFDPKGVCGTLNSGTTEGMNIVPSILQTSGVVSKGNGEAFLMPEKTSSLAVGGGMPGQGYPCVLQSAVYDARGNGDAVFCLQGNGIDRADTAGCNGKGWREDQCYTLNTIDRPAVAYSFDSLASNSMKSKNPYSGCRQVEVAKTLDCFDPNPSKNQGGVAVVQAVYDARGNGDGKTVCTITGDHQNRVTDYTALCVGNGQANQGVSEDATGAHPAEERGHQPIVYENHSQDSRFRPLGDICQTVTAAYGMGGNNQPLVVSDVLPFDTTQVTSDKNWSNPHYGDPCHPLAAQAHVPSVASASIVRRLTPLECERLQGFPDGWTLIGAPEEVEVKDYAYDIEDVEGEHKVVKRVIGTHKETQYFYTDEKGQRKRCADSARYKALGNSIALPFWQWMARRICAQYERTPTMASLFDGIGGFPLVFQRCGAVPVWASEIEEFPIAVTKVRFPDESV